MKQLTNWENINEEGGYANLKVGAYIVKIKDVKDVVEKEYLEVDFDIVEGDFKDYFTTLEKATGKNRGKAYRSYKDNALSFFKQFITAIEKSNPGYKWDWNEKTLIGKQCVIVFREEEYLDAEVNIKTSIKPDEFRSIEALQKGEVKLKPKKELSNEDKIKFADAHKNATNESDTTAEDLPF